MSTVLGLHIASLRGAITLLSWWFATKVLTYAALLGIGLYLRSVIKAWRVGFIELKRGPSEATDQLIARGIQQGRRGAWVFWSVIALTAYLGVAKPF